MTTPYNDDEVAIPACTVPKMWLPSYPCEFCGHEFWAVSSLRCMSCGRRASTEIPTASY